MSGGWLVFIIVLALAGYGVSTLFCAAHDQMFGRGSREPVTKKTAKRTGK